MSSSREGTGKKTKISKYSAVREYVVSYFGIGSPTSKSQGAATWISSPHKINGVHFLMANQCYVPFPLANLTNMIRWHSLYNKHAYKRTCYKIISYNVKQKVTSLMEPCPPCSITGRFKLTSSKNRIDLKARSISNRQSS